MQPSEINAHLLALIKSGQPQNRLLAEQLALSQQVDLLALLRPYAHLTDNAVPTLVDYQELFSKIVYVAYGKKLKELPEGVEELQHITHLLVNKNHLKTISSRFFQFPKLHCLLLNANRIAQLPSSLVGWESLQRLGIGKNRLTALPEDIGRLQRLQTLQVRDNRLTDVPSTLRNCPQLEYLDLAGNRLETLTENLCALPRLRELDLSGNPLWEFPDRLKQLNHLETLSLQDIPLSPATVERIKALLPNTIVYTGSSGAS